MLCWKHPIHAKTYCVLDLNETLHNNEKKNAHIKCIANTKTSNERYGLKRLKRSIKHTETETENEMAIGHTRIIYLNKKRQTKTIDMDRFLSFFSSYISSLLCENQMHCNVSKRWFTTNTITHHKNDDLYQIEMCIVGHALFK